MIIEDKNVTKKRGKKWPWHLVTKCSCADSWEAAFCCFTLYSFIVL